MGNRRTISYVLFALAVVMVLLIGALRGDWLTGVLVGLAFVLVGIIFFRRGK